jgi:DNA replication protein DnaC
MNIEFKKAEDAFKHGHSFFLTGKAGTGKSFFLKSILKDTIKKCIVLAPTGMAAINVNGQTIHSFFKLPINPLLDPVLDAYQFEEEDDKYRLLKEVDCIIIDEISMVRADLLDAIDHSRQRKMF